MLRIKQITFLLFILSVSFTEIFSQGSAGERAKYESQYIVNMPNAGILTKSSFSFNADIFENSGILMELNTAPFSNFNLGFSYGGINILGNQDITWQNLPGILIRIRIFDESLSFPAIAIGFNSQGRGTYLSELKRFQNQSPGFFLSASKFYTWKIGMLGFHGGINYSIEPEFSDRLPNFYGGIEQSLGNRSSVNFEYNANLDEKTGLVMNKRGLFNLSIRYAFTQNMTIEFQFIDLLNNMKGGKGALRRLGIEYIDSF
ncbi:MAG: hypothetical protein EPN82_03960 [Bacteroidetes bacterium]|nr:MAG: hypothetical protein EPN82_03960 [Bacteroidota bacterium]